MRKVKIGGIHKGRQPARKHITYAHLADVDTGEILVTATLNYVVQCCCDPEREYELTNAVEVLQTLFPLLRVLDTSPEFS